MLIPDEIKTLMERLGLTSAALASITACDVRTVSRWISGDVCPAPTAAAILGVLFMHSQAEADRARLRDLCRLATTLGGFAYIFNHMTENYLRSPRTINADPKAVVRDEGGQDVQGDSVSDPQA